VLPNVSTVSNFGIVWQECQVLLGDGDEVRAMRRVDQAIIKVLVGHESRVELAVVDPDVCAFL
jgi:hypothetical protein